MDVDGQAAVGDQLTTDGDLLLVSDEGEWWLGSTAAKCATRQRRLITEGRGSSSATPQISPSRSTVHPQPERGKAVSTE